MVSLLLLLRMLLRRLLLLRVLLLRVLVLLMWLLGLLLWRLLTLSLLLWMLSLESSKERLVACELLRRRDTVDSRTGRVAVGHGIRLAAGIPYRRVLGVGMRHALHVRRLSSALVVTHMSLRNALRVHVWHSQMAVPYRHGSSLSLLISHLAIGSMHLLSRCLSTLGLLRILRPLLSRWAVWNALLCAQHLGIALLLGLNHLLTALAGLLG